MPNEVAELTLKIKSDQVEKADKRFKNLGNTGKRTEEQLERLDFTMGALNRNLLDATRRTDRLSKEQREATRTTNRLLREQIKATRETKRGAAATRRLTKANRGLTASSVRNAVALGGVTFALIRYSQAVVRADKAGTQIRNSLNFVTGSIEGTRREFEFIVRKADKYGQDIRTLAREYSKFGAAAKGTALEGAESRLVLEGMSAAASTLALDAEQVSGAMKAMEQIMSKGKVQAEELRGQLGERIPGAFQIAARAMNVTTAELNKMLELGQVASVDFLPRFSRELIKTFGGDIATKTDTLTGAINRLNNEIFLMFTDDQNRLADSFKDIIVEMTEALKDPEFRSALVQMNNMLASMIKAGASVFSDVFNAPQRIAQHLDIAQMEGLMRGLEGESDPAKRDELRSMLGVVSNRISARSRAMKPKPESPESPDSGVSAAVPEFKSGATSARQTASIRDKALSFFDDPKARLEKLRIQQIEEVMFLEQHQDILFSSKEEYENRVLVLEQSFAEKKAAIDDELLKSRQVGLTGQLGEARDFFGDLAVLSQGESEKLFKIQKAFALSDATVKGFQAIQGAWASAPFPANIPAVAMTTAKTAVNIASIESQGFSGNFADGGFLNGPHSTGDRTTFNGNRGEVVLNGRQQSNFMDMANGQGRGMGAPNLTINNFGSPEDVSARQDPNGGWIVDVKKQIKRELTGELTNGVTDRQGPFNRAMEGRFRTR